MATARDADPSVHDHVVAFYEQDDHLASAVAQFLLPALTGDGAAIVVATSDHRQMIEAQLRAEGVDVRLAQKKARLVVLDAAETLASVTPAGSAPDAARFRDVVGGLIDRAAEGHATVRVYGEMVALLWADGNVDDAIALEALWNDLATSKRFSLLCGYPVDELDQRKGTNSFLTVCRQHSMVVPSERFLADAKWADQLVALLRAEPETEAAKRDLDRLRGEFITTVVDSLRSGLLRQGEALLAEAQRTMTQIDLALPS